MQHLVFILILWALAAALLSIGMFALAAGLAISVLFLGLIAAQRSSLVRAVFVATATATGIIGIFEALPGVFQWIAYVFDTVFGLGRSMARVAAEAPVPFKSGRLAMFDFHGLPAAFASPLFLMVAGVCAFIASLLSEKKRDA